MDTELIKLEVFIPKATYDAVVLLTAQQNAVLSNNVSRILNEGIAAIYERWPHLKDGDYDLDGKWNRQLPNAGSGSTPAGREE